MAELVYVSKNEWWNVMKNERLGSNTNNNNDQINQDKDEHEEIFLSPVTNPIVMAACGTIAFESLEQMKIIESENNLHSIKKPVNQQSSLISSFSPPHNRPIAFIVPYGGGAMTIGIATVLKNVYGDRAHIYASEIDKAAPLTAALDAGEPTRISTDPTWVDGIGSSRVFDQNYCHLTNNNLLKESLVVSEQEVADSIREIWKEERLVVEGAGASSLAAAVKYKSRIESECSRVIQQQSLSDEKMLEKNLQFDDHEKEVDIVCVISGGNIDVNLWSEIVMEKDSNI
eukprot:gb/GECH01005633.1/.p1 GENE.gb/GECH01005633.1/~~gb/GECH01005633.1/.p1  ORF type:complete len:286 (+),score=86.93 gb/GECH01005633.1/:1-858(+)